MVSPAGGVIVNADDFGLRAEVNAAVGRAHAAGVLSSTSLLVNAPATAEAVAMARDLPGLGLGVHLALTELQPLTRCPHLAPGGRFPATHGQVFRRLLTGRVPFREIRDEVFAQVEAALATGLAFDHLDGHGHVHLLPGVLEAVVAAGTDLGIGAVRWPSEPAWERPAGAPAPGPAARGKRWLLRRLGQRGDALVAGLWRPAACFGLAASGRFTRPRFLALARVLPRGVSEIMVHPATVDEVAYPGYLGAQELAALLDPDVAAALPVRRTFANG